MDVLITSAPKVAPHADRVSQLEDEVRALRQQLRHCHRLATVGTMAAMVAHEFNNILTPMVNYAILARNNPALVEKAIAIAEQGGQRAADICRSILTMAKPEADAPEQMNLGELIDETVGMMAREPAKDGITLAIDVSAKITVTARRVEVQQVILNLLMNARTALLRRSATGRQIRIAAACKRGRTVVTVQDNGPGIAPEHLDKVFEPFFTTCGSAEDTGGHGLGLAICEEIVSASGGGIAVSSSPETGAAFTVTLPA